MIPVLPFLDRRLDRIYRFDERNRRFPMRTLVTGQKLRSYTWRYIQLDQGSEGACTGFSVTMEAMARPAEIRFRPGVDPNVMARQVYHRAKQLDEWPGEAYEGSSVLAAVKAGTEIGWYREYRWANPDDPVSAAIEVALAVGYRGPVVMGTWWHEGMFRADAEGFLNLTGQKSGGHAYLLTRYSVDRDALWTPNSWGGQGQGWIRRRDLVMLLADHGEAAIMVKRLRPVA